MKLFSSRKGLIKTFVTGTLLLAVLYAPLSSSAQRARRVINSRHRAEAIDIPVTVGRNVSVNPFATSAPLVLNGGPTTIAAMVDMPSSPAVVPTTPPGCTQDPPLSFANPTAQTIPAVGTIQSNITVSTPHTYLRDVDVFTNISHVFNDDLEITLTSPAGTVVTLSSHNGNGSNNFQGTTWDDSADPNGIPTTSLSFDNPNQAQNHPYVSGSVATPLAPEEGLAAFNGENPNGVWKLTVADTLTDAGFPDGGSLNNWSLNIVTLASTPNLTTLATVTNNTPVAISTGNPSLISSTLNIPAAGSIAKVIVSTNITHTSEDDLEIALTSPANTTVTLSNGIWDSGGFPNGANTYAGTTWDDDVNPAGTVPYSSNPNHGGDHPYTNNVIVPNLTPIEGLGAFIGQSPTGTWTLRIADQFTGEGGSLNSWSVTVITAACPSAGEVTVTGHVLTPEGRGLRNARVVATDSHGVSHSAPTGRRGTFLIPELDAGETYVFSVVSRLYVYSPVVMTLNDSLVDLNFVPDGTAPRLASRR